MLFQNRRVFPSCPCGRPSLRHLFTSTILRRRVQDSATCLGAKGERADGAPVLREGGEMGTQTQMPSTI